jgi:Family of unknown function (DUF6279)
MSRFPPALARWLAVAALALGLAGCGLGLVYPRLDSVVGFYVEGLVTLDKAQSAALKRTLASNLDWHRQSELERYSAFLRDLAETVAGGTSREDWSGASRRTEQYWREIFEQAAPGYTALAATFTDAQVAELLENLQREDEEAWQDFARRKPEEQQARREKSVRRALERFTGPLTAGQRDLIQGHAARSQPFMAEWRENRRVWREALADALAQRDGGAEFESRMFVLIARPDELWTPAYRTALERRRESLIDLMVELDATLTSQQRAAARRQLLALADEVQGLRRGRG